MDYEKCPNCQTPLSGTTCKNCGTTPHEESVVTCKECRRKELEDKAKKVKKKGVAMRGHYHLCRDCR
jgi:hypothetical protein